MEIGVIFLLPVQAAPQKRWLENEDQNMKVNVTWRDIRAGKAMTASECMVAVALKRELRIDYVSVGLTDARLELDGRFVTVRLPLAVSRKIRFWEKFHFAVPFSFDFPNLEFAAPLAALATPPISHQAFGHQAFGQQAPSRQAPSRQALDKLVGAVAT
jgi:hypothetical protein